jgi:hypothetical protein
MALVQTPTAFSELLNFLASTPSHEEILAYAPYEELQSCLSYLLEKNRNDRLSDEEKAELDEALSLDHFVTMLKIRVRKKLMANFTRSYELPLTSPRPTAQQSSAR